MITGGNKGIGLAVVTKLLKETDWKVYLGARNKGRGDAAVANLVAANATWRARLEMLLIDPTSDASVTDAAQRLEESSVTLHGVVNNAGGFLPFSEMLNLHLYGPKRVTEALLPLMAHGGVIVNVSSGGAAVCVAKSRSDRKALLRREDLSWEEIDGLAKEVLHLASFSNSSSSSSSGGGGTCVHRDPSEQAESDAAMSDAAMSEVTGVAWSLGGYGFTKALLNCYTCWLQHRHPEMRIGAVNPGFIETDMSRPYLQGQTQTPAQLGMGTTADGALAPCRLLLGEPTRLGQYLDSDGTWRGLGEVNPRDFSA